MRRTRRSSVRITLALIGSAALHGCDDGPRYQNRDHYATLEECRADWNRRADECQQTTRPGSSSRIWMGPPYDSDSAAAKSRRAIGTTSSLTRGSSASSSSVSRGGFGSSSGFHSGGG